MVKAEFLKFVPLTYVAEVTRDSIVTFDAKLRELGRSKRTIANKRQRLQSMLRAAGVDPDIFPPKPKFDKKLPTIYTPSQLGGLFGAAKPYERMVCNLALKLGLRDQEVQFAEFTDISWHESVFRVRSKPNYEFTVKDYEERDIPIPTDFLGELKEWKQEHPDQNLIVANTKGNPNTKLLVMIKRLARQHQTSNADGVPTASPKSKASVDVKSSSCTSSAVPASRPGFAARSIPEPSWPTPDTRISKRPCAISAPPRPRSGSRRSARSSGIEVPMLFVRNQPIGPAPEFRKVEADRAFRGELQRRQKVL